MPVEIRLPPRFQLRTLEKEPHVLDLPEIELAPSSRNNLPYISSINCSIEGTPQEVAAQIQSAYQPYTFKPPLKLPSLHRLRKNPCRLDKPLPPELQCTLQVTIEYFDSDPGGSPDLSNPMKIETLCHLFSSDVSQQQARDPVFKTSAPPKESAPTQLKTKQKKEFSEKKEITFPGWLAIDLGTSNSTVTLFDPRVVSPPLTLPKEQEQRLCQRLAEWLNSPPGDTLPGVSASEWEKFTSEIGKNLKVGEISSLGELFSVDNNSHLLEAIRQIEISMGNRSELFRRAASKKLNSTYHEVFRVPPLNWQNLIPVELDLNSRATEIPSELEIESWEPLKVIMGEQISNRRNDAVAGGAASLSAQGTLASKEDIQAKFHSSPKRYFGSNKKPWEVTIDGQHKSLEVNDLIQASYAHLKHLTEEFRERNPGRFAEGSLRQSRRDLPHHSLPSSPPGYCRAGQ